MFANYTDMGHFTILISIERKVTKETSVLSEKEVSFGGVVTLLF